MDARKSDAERVTQGSQPITPVSLINSLPTRANTLPLSHALTVSDYQPTERRRPSAVSFAFSSTTTEIPIKDKDEGPLLPTIGPQNSQFDGRSATMTGSRPQHSGERSSIIATDIISGPVDMQMCTIYVFYAILLLCAYVADWASFPLWWYGIYFGVVILALSVGRYLNFKKPLSLSQLYLSLGPYVLFHIMTLDAHLILTVVWFIAVTGINMQVSIPHLGRHVLVSSCCFVGIYTAIIVISNTTNIYRGDTPIAEEITFGVSLILLGISLGQLQRFVVNYSSSLVDRQHQVNKLFNQNLLLKNQLRSMKKSVDLDLDSPLTKVIQLLKEFAQKYENDEDYVDSIEQVIELLSSNHLFGANSLNSKNDIESDAAEYIKSVLSICDKVQPEAILSNMNLTAECSMLVARSNQADAEIADMAARFLQKVDNWAFDIHEFAEITNGRPLYYLGMSLMNRYAITEFFPIEESVLRSFFTQIESNYKQNPYHNATHAADVLHAMHFFLGVLGMAEAVKPEDVFSALIAAAIHDVDHPGVNNSFLINSSSPLALRYNDTAVLEMHHCSKAFELIFNDASCNIFHNFAADKFKTCRNVIVSMVLATDMSSHFEHIGKFKSKLSGTGFDLTDTKDRQLLMDISIKCADISNPAKPTAICKKWTDLIMEEFFQQGDEERRNHLPISMFMDRTNTNIPKCQIGFIDYVVTPLYEVWDQYVNEDDKFDGLECLKTNREYWKKQQDQELKGIFIAPS